MSCCFLNQRTLIGLKSNHDQFSIAISLFLNVTLFPKTRFAFAKKKPPGKQVAIDFHQLGTLRTSHSCLTKMVCFPGSSYKLVASPYAQKNLCGGLHLTKNPILRESKPMFFVVVKFQVVNFNLQSFRDCFSSVSPQLGGMKWNLEPFFSFVLVQCCSGVCCFFSLFLVGCSILHMPL